ncbi:hypothetical protein HG535_0D01440 [Zygotorulaspora mrakii]|uniref:Mitochondrial carrier protein n=1 Tax=Zygotorulaspora mrakii TaxID=42260 RepID=A0A7H9B1X4_ZYGMR|nr:uncharacterized protein HG535_0D01440 [Zygotorulaspora mrakii]QLG72436.1 hypothetical protein HG535_0D01440 [Zygotorulaspora mrakii]
MWNYTSSIPVAHYHHDHPHMKPTRAFAHQGAGDDDDSDKDDDNNKQNGSARRSLEENNSPLLLCIVAGGIGGAIGDTSMHSLDTVKTRQQGAPSVPSYRNMLSAYRTIFMQEGFRKGLYGGYCAAMLGSFPSAAIFFGTYEYFKRKFIDHWKINETISHLSSGFLGDLFSSIVYVPSEVLKTRLQLQGKYNNPYFNSGYNYKNLRDTVKTVIKAEGAGALLFGYKATLARDLPFSALQFAFYEKCRQWAYKVENKDIMKDELSLSSEIITGAVAGGLAGILTTPLDVIKTRVQTQQPINPNKYTSSAKPANLSNSLFFSLRTVYKSEGILGFFSGVGPRFIWTSVQSSIMLLLYQIALRDLNEFFPRSDKIK